MTKEATLNLAKAQWDREGRGMTEQHTAVQGGTGQASGRSGSYHVRGNVTSVSPRRDEADHG